MNERIDEFIGYAKFMAEETTKRQISLNTELRTFSKFFAELIVAEATKALWTEECMTSDLALAEYSRNSNRVRDHFGVEE